MSHLVAFPTMWHFRRHRENARKVDKLTSHVALARNNYGDVKLFGLANVNKSL